MILICIAAFAFLAAIFLTFTTSLRRADRNAILHCYRSQRMRKALRSVRASKSLAETHTVAQAALFVPHVREDGSVYGAEGGN